MKPRHDVARAEHVAVTERDVLFAVAIVPKRDDAKLACARGQVGDRFDLDADAMLTEAVTVVIFVALDEIFEPRNGCQTGEARLVGALFHYPRALPRLAITSSWRSPVRAP